MTVIFLDFDGVITTQNSISKARTMVMFKDIAPEDNYEYQIDKDLAQNVASLQKALDAQIVISSTWRLLHPLSDLRGYLKRRGGIDPHTVIDCTPDSIRGSRGTEIKAWLDEHPEVTSFVILDDDRDVLDVPEFKANWLRTTFMNGFDNERLNAAIQRYKK